MIDLKKILAEDAALVDAKLEQILSDCRDAFPGVVSDAMRYSVMSGGKRIRPCLVIEACKMWSGDFVIKKNLRKAVTLAAALELVHTYSLIHDDLPCMDNDDLRRGKPTCHKVYGEATAVLAGDALLTLAFEVITQDVDLDDSEKVSAVRVLSSRAGHHGMIGGQELDMQGEKKTVSFEAHRNMNNLKTGELFRAAVMMGTGVIGARGYGRAIKYASRIGEAFQVIDDLLDDGEDDEKTTYLTYMSRDEAKAYAQKLTDEAIAEISALNGGEVLTELAKSLIERTF